MKPVFESVYTTQTPVSRPAARVDRAAPTDGAAISDRIEQAFDTASATTGTSFDYLVKTAQRESSMDPAAKAKTSSAAGLFQFIESTWLETMKSAGPELGLGAYADKIEVGSDGRYRVPNAEDRQEIMALRHDPEIASMMAGALTRRNAEHLASSLGREPNAGELYIAHFLGAGGATSFIRLAESQPDATAADYFPRQAAANKGIFYAKGEARTMAEVYQKLVGQHGGIDGIAVDRTNLMTAFAGEGDSASSGAAAAIDAQVSAEARVAQGWKAVAPADAFSALFRTDQPALQATAAAGFWHGYTQAPALFDVAVAEDAKELARQSAVQPPLPPTASPSLAQRAAPGLPPGPLDLSRFLDTGES